MVKPLLESVPEIDVNKAMVTKLSGGIELSNVTFRYGPEMPLILDNVSLRIRPGQYVAIVGKTGCGKSTLMRILLGFEKPLKGAVYYDGRDLNTLDPKSLRRRIGSVMQDGKLFMGDIFSNIAISAPGLTLEDAWEAAEISGFADDIRQMPMGMNTLISEGHGSISGGQRQRLMIARAIAPKPKILMFDEATSALDNLTQKRVSESLNQMKCTRIVIAHRLSTIRQCDRIIVLDRGKIIEDGKYEDLINEGVSAEELTEFGPVYLPESDKRLSGTIAFRIKNSGSLLYAPFSMAVGNFHRNQTWIVYAYYIGSSKFIINNVLVVPWEEVDEKPKHQIPNW